MKTFWRLFFSGLFFGISGPVLAALMLTVLFILSDTITHKATLGDALSGGFLLWLIFSVCAMPIGFVPASLTGICASLLHHKFKRWLFVLILLPIGAGLSYGCNLPWWRMVDLSNMAAGLSVVPTLFLAWLYHWFMRMLEPKIIPTVPEHSSS